jgi:hypothetical protein
VVVHTVALVIVRRWLAVLGYGATPDADVVEIAVLRHQPAPTCFGTVDKFLGTRFRGTIW